MKIARIIACALIAELCFAGSTGASQLISTFEFGNGSGYAPCQPGLAEFYLGLEGPPPLFLMPIGAGLAYWSDGQSGSYDITPSNEPRFADFSSVLTNGVNDIVYLLSGMQGCNNGVGGGVGVFESDYFGMPTDLAGFDLEFIRIHVADVDIQTLDPELMWQTWSANVTYEFWGTPIPEPATLALMCIAGVIWRQRRLS